MGLVSLVGQQGERDCYFNFYYIGLLNSVQSLSRVWLFVTPWTTQWNSPWTISWSTTGFSVHHQLPEPAQTHMHWSVMPSNHLILCHPLFLLPLIFPSIRVFSNESVLHIRWPKYWSFSFSISPSNEYSGQISFRMDWSPCCPRDSQVFSNITVQKHQFLGAQLSHPYMTTGKTIALTIQKVFYIFLNYFRNLYFPTKLQELST